MESALNMIAKQFVEIESWPGSSIDDLEAARFVPERNLDSDELQGVASACPKLAMATSGAEEAGSAPLFNHCCWEREAEDSHLRSQTMPGCTESQKIPRLNLASLSGSQGVEDETQFFADKVAMYTIHTPCISDSEAEDDEEATATETWGEHVHTKVGGSWTTVSTASGSDGSDGEATARRPVRKPFRTVPDNSWMRDNATSNDARIVSEDGSSREPLTSCTLGPPHGRAMQKLISQVQEEQDTVRKSQEDVHQFELSSMQKRMDAALEKNAILEEQVKLLMDKLESNEEEWTFSPRQHGCHVDDCLSAELQALRVDLRRYKIKGRWRELEAMKATRQADLELQASEDERSKQAAEIEGMRNEVAFLRQENGRLLLEMEEHQKKILTEMEASQLASLITDANARAAACKKQAKKHANLLRETTENQRKMKSTMEARLQEEKKAIIERERSMHKRDIEVYKQQVEQAKLEINEQKQKVEHASSEICVYRRKSEVMKARAMEYQANARKLHRHLDAIDRQRIEEDARNRKDFFFTHYD